jgi:hypothetical protein
MGIVHKEAKGGTSHANHTKEEVTVTIQISIQTNPPWKILLWAKLK